MKNLLFVLSACLLSGVATNIARANDCNDYALRTNYNLYDKLKKERKIKEFFCSNESSNASVGMGGTYEYIGVELDWSKEKASQLCKSKDESYFEENIHHLTTSFMPDKALELCIGGLTFKATILDEKKSLVTLSAGYIPLQGSREWADIIGDLVVNKGGGVECPPLTKAQRALSRDSLKLSCNITNPDVATSITLKTTKGDRIVELPHIYKHENKKPDWCYAKIGQEFRCFNELESPGLLISCNVKNSPCPENTAQAYQTYCAARYYSDYILTDGKYARMFNNETGRSETQIYTKEKCQ